MEPTSHPPKIIETIAGLLLPRACREQVLGDLHERYVSPFQYTLDVVRTLPFAVASQIRRRSSLQSILSDALAIYVPFLVSAILLTGRAFLTADPPGWIRLAIPTLIAVMALVLRDTYAATGKGSSPSAGPDAIFGVACALLSQLLLAVVGLNLLLPRPSLIGGGSLALLALVIARFYGSGREEGLSAELEGLSLNGVGRRAKAFQTRIRKRNIREYVAAFVVVAVFGRGIWIRPDLVSGIGGFLVVVGVLYAVYSLHQRGSARTLPSDASSARLLDFHRKELERQRDAQRSIWSWYILPLVPGLMFLMLASAMANPNLLGFSSVVSLCFLLSVFFLIAKLNHRAADRLQMEIDALNALTSESR